jgi:hypothetical protein
MSVPDRRRAGIVVVVIAAMAALVLQLLTGRAVVGPIGLLVLALPGIILAESLGASRRSWPERLLSTMAIVIVAAIFGSLVPALSPRGLDAAAVAGVEAVVLTVALTLWIWRRPRHPASRAATGRRRREALSAIGPASIAMAGLGIVLGAAGFAVATRAAQVQDVSDVLDFWSVRAASGQPAVIGVANLSPTRLTCDVTITRPAHSPIAFHLDTLGSGQTWLENLPAADPLETAPWQPALRCTDPSGAQLQRALSIDPPR